jgi:hypothetical protein
LSDEAPAGSLNSLEIVQNRFDHAMFLIGQYVDVGQLADPKARDTGLHHGIAAIGTTALPTSDRCGDWDRSIAKVQLGMGHADGASHAGEGPGRLHRDEIVYLDLNEHIILQMT